MPSPPPPLFLSLPEDILGQISASLRSSDLCSLILTCRSLHCTLSSSDKAWHHHCLRLAAAASLPAPLLALWRRHLPSSRHLCRFLTAVAPLLGVWVHQNPELGNVVAVLPAFLSVVGCRVIPQELGPLGIHHSPLLFTPVFEILAAPDGSVAGFFLHGRDAGEDSLYAGSLRSVPSACNVLFLEVDEPTGSGQKHLQLTKGKSFPPAVGTSGGGSAQQHSSSSPRGICRSVTTIPRTPPPPPPMPAPFSRLAFGDRRRLLEFVAGKVRVKVPPGIADAPLFFHACTGSRGDDGNEQLLAERWMAMLRLHKAGWGCVDWREAKLGLDLTDNGRSSRDRSSSSGSFARENGNSIKKRSATFSVGGYIKHFIGKGSSGSSSSSSSPQSSGESKYVQLNDFLRPRDAIGLSLRASNVKLTTYRVWPNMHDNRFALYRLPVQANEPGREFAGLWGGTFGWPPGKASEDKPGKALFFLLLSYEEVEGRVLLIATKILEGTHYVLHPNGSAMFIVKADEPSLEPFPWDTDGSCLPIEVKQSYSGEGIANGYGFRYPGSKPGSLYVIQNGILAFVWTETRAVLTLEKLDLQELLRKGERVPAPPPIANFVYLTKSYSNVFAGFTNNTSSSQAARHQ